MSVTTLIQYVGWAAVSVAIVASFLPRADRGLTCLRWYFVIALLADVAEFGVLAHYGYRSLQYRYAYYGCDLAVVVLGFFVLARLVEVAFSRTEHKLHGFRLGAILLFSGVACCSAYIVYSLHGGLTTAHLGRELEQNFSFVGMILAMVLTVVLNMIRTIGVRLRRVVLSFSLLYSASAFVNSLAALWPSVSPYLMYAVPFLVTACTGLIAYSLIATEPERRAAMARVPARAAEGAW